MFGATATSGASGFASTNGGSPYSTPFILVEERNNKYKIDDRLKKTLPDREAIPFLRTNDGEYKKIIFRKHRNHHNRS